MAEKTHFTPDTGKQHLSISDSVPVAVCGRSDAYNFHMGRALDSVIDSPATCPDCRNAILGDEL